MLTNLSKKPFWDTPIKNLEKHKHSTFILERIMRYGTIEDYKILKTTYTHEELKAIARTVKELDAVSLSFLCADLGLEKKEFRGLTKIVSREIAWNF